MKKSKPILMGVLNITPDSFSDGGKFLKLDKSLRQAALMLEQGASIIDIGGESTRPGAKLVSIDEELSRIIPIIDSIKKNLDVKISVDTSKTQVMTEVLKHGVDLINDVNALQADGAMEAVANSSCQICLMHKQGQPQSMQQAPAYKNLVQEVYDFLLARSQVCLKSGIDSSRIIIDVGFGFGKTVAHNLSLIKHLESFSKLDFPILAAVSRKSTIGAILNRNEDERLEGSLALALMAYMNGASLFRVHDVRQTMDVLKMAHAVLNAQ